MDGGATKNMRAHRHSGSWGSCVILNLGQGVGACDLKGRKAISMEMEKQMFAVTGGDSGTQTGLWCLSSEESPTTCNPHSL